MYLIQLLCVLPHGAGKAVWKLDDPAVLAAERAERLAAAAEAARRKLANALDKKVGMLLVVPTMMERCLQCCATMCEACAGNHPSPVCHCR